MATNVKILLRRGLRNELAGDTLSAGEMGYTTDTNQLYVGVEEAINELRFDPFANAHAVIQSWLDSADCPVSGLTVDEDLVVTDIPSGQIDNIITALNTYTQTLVFNSSTATFTVGELLTQYNQKRTVLTSPNVIPDINSITANFTIEGEVLTPTTQSLADLLTGLQTSSTLKTENVISQVVSDGNTSKLKFCRIDGKELKITFPATVLTAGAFVIGNTYTILLPGTTDFTLIGAVDSKNGTVFKATGVGTGTGTATYDTADAIGFTQNIFSVTGGSFVTGTEYTITSLGTDTLATHTPVQFVVGVEYTILTVGTTDFTLVGSANNNVGTTFTATGTGSGTGTATFVESTVQANWESAGAPASLTAGSFVSEDEYTIVTVGTTDFTKFGSANNNVGTTFTATSDGEEQYTAGTFTIGRVYTISDIGTTDFTLIGANSNTIGHSFTATGTGSGTGDAYFTGTGTATSVIVGSTFTASGFGLVSDGIATWDNGVNTVAELTGYDVYANGTITASAPNKIITAGEFVVGRVYTIVTSGTTDYTLIGSTDSNVGTVFTATGVGAGTGTAKEDGTTTVTVQVNEFSDYFGYLQEGITTVTAGAFVSGTEYKILVPGTTDFTLIGATNSNVGTIFTATGVGAGTGTATTIEPYANAPDTTEFYKFGTPSTPDYSALSPAVDTTSVTDGTEAKIGLFGSKRKNVEVLTEESRNQLFTNQHLKSYSASTGLRSDLYKKELAGTTGTFLSYDADEATTFFIDYSLKQVGSSIIFVRTGTLRMINGVPQEIDLAKLTDTNVEVHQDTNTDTIVDANEMSNIVFTAVIDGTSPNQNIKVNYTQDTNFTTEISYTVKRWTM